MEFCWFLALRRWDGTRMGVRLAGLALTIQKVFLSLLKVPASPPPLSMEGEREARLGPLSPFCPTFPALPGGSFSL